jgi:hypothetical protein
VARGGRPLLINHLIHDGDRTLKLVPCREFTIIYTCFNKEELPNDDGRHIGMPNYYFPIFCDYLLDILAVHVKGYLVRHRIL